MSTTTKSWSLTSWRSLPIKQQPEYTDVAALEKVLEKIRILPPMVNHKEIDTLKQQLAECGQGKRFLLQGGDCAERFLDCNPDVISNKFKILLQMSLIIIWGSKIPVTRIARMAGQFAKPRTSNFEIVNGKQIYSYKGDNVNGIDPNDRTPDPQRLVDAYFHSAATLNYLRSLISGGVASLFYAESWKLDAVLSDHTRSEYEEIVSRILDDLDFLSAIGADDAPSLKSVDMFTSHEGLLLNYEEALTKEVGGKYYNLSAHFLWIGDRTRQLDEAHIEYFRGITNPIGIKVGPTSNPVELQQLVRILNPNKEKGRLTLITRLGATKVKEILPGLIRAVNETEIPVVWVSDPCHGNTEVTSDGFKTRKFDNIIQEVLITGQVHQQCGTIFGGVHLELTGDDVTECLGGSSQLAASELAKKYETTCDPRLNYTQSLDLAFNISNSLKSRRERGRKSNF